MSVTQGAVGNVSEGPRTRGSRWQDGLLGPRDKLSFPGVRRTRKKRQRKDVGTSRGLSQVVGVTTARAVISKSAFLPSRPRRRVFTKALVTDTVCRVLSMFPPGRDALHTCHLQQRSPSAEDHASRESRWLAKAAAAERRCWGRAAATA